MNKTILYIHQSAELYGSDKALYFLLKEVNRNPNFSIIVVLPNEGPLKQLLESQSIRVIVFPVIKVSRGMFSFKNLVLLPSIILKRTKELKKLLSNTKIDLVHSNTLAVLLGAFFARRYKVMHLWHIHEIIEEPTIVRFCYPILVNKYSQMAVFNSEASKRFLTKNTKELIKKSIVNLNGLDRDTPLTKEGIRKNIRKDLFEVGENDVVMALVGRISKWKGQELLLEAFYQLQFKHKDLRLIFVGSAPPNQHYLVHKLEERINRLGLKDKCRIIPFQKNIWNIWDSIDFAVVPSTKPEPFGLVALEAMLAKKAVIASKHGGLVEIIKDNKTGYFFEPNNAEELERSIDRLLSDRMQLVTLGLNGHEHAIKNFSLQNHCKRFIGIYNQMLNSKK